MQLLYIKISQSYSSNYFTVEEVKTIIKKNKERNVYVNKKIKST